ncbi:PTS fructose-like transporter subunit EIIB [Yersinia pseudotuberculosis]|uniref:protein-N(pi)-phosphohistidine--D-fructose phosphotransferase n=2 Tax=Yersinia pseudotuberculosis complex TaxID=1649845 RepID=A0A0T9JSW2_YERPU|nr:MULTISPECIES: PTS fructose-like transporter subunit IIB [Yersinia pseudotuberculosis complex]PSH23719.1 PTS fructose-like transporter subunit EIIB [Yersinia pseudotuberculosis]CND27533.1 putative PTS system fructose-like transporter subunit EIIB [Yersinia pseudotuberculosis]CRG51125.1 putative PTS system fructose-like transporter subunit EIIB [Yersinia wautersii]SUP86143.1 putative PTS system fructose-like transporter subunit EIIB [Yersinia pseudotuberculosis]
MNLNLIAVTACVSGVAHTYMAAERLEKLCHQEKWSIKVETQGALGIENALTSEDVKCADVVLLITDIEIDGGERFAHSRSIKMSISSFLLTPHKTIEIIKQISTLSPTTQINII